jgi:monofunctional chorismate mutase
MTEELDPARIDRYREEIDRIDSELLQMLNRRAACALSIGKIKKENNLPVHVPEREQEVLERLIAENGGPCSEASVRSVFTAIFEQMRALEEEVDGGEEQ